MKTCFRFAAVIVALTLFSLLSSVSPSRAQTASGSFTVQGRLTDMNGAAISNAMHTIHASVYANGGATAIYSETDTVTTTDGVFSFLLGSGQAASGSLTLNPNGSYTLGISVDNGAELAPRIAIASVPIAVTARTADTANFALGITPNAVATIDSGILAGVGNNIVTSVNGLHGNVVLMGGGNLGLTTSGDTIGLNFTGSGSGGLTLPFAQTLSSGGSLFSLTNSGSGAAELIANTGAGNALNLTASGASALSATANGATSTLDITNTGGGNAITALSITGNGISATTNSASSTALQLKNAAGSGLGQLIQAMSASGTVLDLTTQGMTLAAAQDTNSTLLTLKNLSTSSSGNILAAVNSGNGTIFSLSGMGAATLNASAGNALSISNSAGAAISASGSSASGAVLQVRNASTGTSAGLISAINGSGGTVFSVAGNGATNIQSSVNNALSVSSSAGTAINASSSAGVAINATTSVAGSAALQVQSTASGTGNAVLKALNASGNTVLNIASNGATTITSSASTGLTDSVSSGNTAVRLVGGLSISGPAGTGSITAGNLSTTISNAYATANSIILVTPTNAVTGLLPLVVSSTGSGSFTVSLVNLLTSAVSFNYLIINQ